MNGKPRQHMEALSHRLGLAPDAMRSGLSAAAVFPFLAPPSWYRKISASDDPEGLIRQVLPLGQELDDVPGFGADPLAEEPAAQSGLVEKYHGRLLLMVTRRCAGHCRFCFRRHVLDAPVDQDELQRAFRERMATGSDITEVILSGGDPLVLSDRRLSSWLEVFNAYAQLRRVRIHTRGPVFSPARITPEFAAIVAASRHPVVIVVHVNHPDELDGETSDALARLRSAGVLLLSQTVLLAGVNDSTDTLAALFERAVECGLAPYYLHQLDRVAGAAHFEVDKSRGLELMRELRRKLPGYLVPRYVEEVAGAASKRPIVPGGTPCP
jgi:EF-P beta-lysylation protein EpmB